MLWYCGYQAFPQVSAADLARRFLRRHDAGSNQPKDLRGWYAFPSGVSGFVLAEATTPAELSKILEPYSRLVSWTIEAATELNYNQVLEELRRSTHRLAVDDLAAGASPAEMAERAQHR